MKRIAVVGGGIVGLSCALRLAEQGHGVTLFDDPDAAKPASWGNAGHLATEQVAPLASLANLRSVPRRRFAAGGALDLPWRAFGTWAPFAARMVAASAPARFRAGSAALRGLLGDALPAWRRLADDLGASELVRDAGHVVLWESAASARAGRRAWGSADIGTARFADLPPDELARVQALTRVPIADAIRFSGTGQVADLDRLRERLLAALAAHGVALEPHKAALERDGGRVRVAGHASDLVLVAAGARSGALLRDVGHRTPIVAERGYHIRARADCWPADLPPLVFEDRATIVTRFADRVQAASFVEFDRFDAPADPRKWARLEAHVAALGLPLAGPFERWMGARPTLPDYLPAIGRSPRADNLFYAFGHQHLGLTLAPITAELVAALVDERAPAVDLSPFDLTRLDKRKA